MGHFLLVCLFFGTTPNSKQQKQSCNLKTTHTLLRVCSPQTSQTQQKKKKEENYSQREGSLQINTLPHTGGS